MSSSCHCSGFHSATRSGEALPTGALVAWLAPKRDLDGFPVYLVHTSKSKGRSHSVLTTITWSSGPTGILPLQFREVSVLSAKITEKVYTCRSQLRPHHIHIVHAQQTQLLRSWFFSERGHTRAPPLSSRCLAPLCVSTVFVLSRGTQCSVAPHFGTTDSSDQMEHAGPSHLGRALSAEAEGTRSSPGSWLCP